MNQDKKEVRVVAAAILKGDKVLIACRSQRMKYPYQWEFPGGKVEENESDYDALAREIKEELDCGIEPSDFIGSATHHIYTIYLYLVKEFQGEPQPIEHNMLKWISIEQLLDHPLSPADRTLAKLLYNYFLENRVFF